MLEKILMMDLIMVYMKQVLQLEMAIRADEANIAIQLSSGQAYISGYRTERLSTTYKRCR